MTRKTSQLEHVEHLLRANGKRGVHTNELRAIMIANPSERIRKLKDAGWVIQVTREKLHGAAFGARYVKVSEPEVERDSDERRAATIRGSGPAPAEASRAGVAVSLSPDTLFDVPAEPTPHWRSEAA